jgi:glycosyltransferase involved in cell wall biosynthesis
MTFQVTIGICVRNGQRMLRNTVNSILYQDYPQERVQIIFVDDGSVDKTPEIIKSYLPVFGDRAKSLKTSWMGLGHARNLIVKEADGEYLLFVDADQILTSTYVKRQVEFLNQNPQVGITAGVFKTVPRNIILNLEVAPYIVNQKNYGKPRSLLWKNDKLIGTGGTTFRTQAIRQVTGFNENIKGAGEDTDLIVRMKSVGWQLQPNKAELYELHGGLSKPKDLWNKYFWYGYGCQRNFAEIGNAFSLSKMTPIAAFITGMFYSHPAYKFLHQKQVFLMPLHFGFKHAAWTLGFIKGQLKRQKN